MKALSNVPAAKGRSRELPSHVSLLFQVSSHANSRETDTDRHADTHTGEKERSTEAGSRMRAVGKPVTGTRQPAGCTQLGLGHCRQSSRESGLQTPVSVFSL